MAGTLAKLPPGLNRHHGVLLVTDETRLADPRPAVASLPRGAAVLLRHYGQTGRDTLAHDLAGLCRRKRLALWVAGDWRLAARVGAAGVHLPQPVARHAILAPLLGWCRRGHGLSIAAHDRGALHRARRLGASQTLLSPVFATRSHPGAPILGPLRFALWARLNPTPVFALGGISARTWRRVRNAAGFAGLFLE